MLVAALAISAAAVVYFIFKVGDNWAGVWRGLKQANYFWVLPSVGALGLFYFFRTLRLRAFVSAVEPVSFGTVGSATLVGFMANCVLPLRVGEIIRPWMISRRGRIDFGQAAGIAMGLERVFDLLGLVMLLAATLLALALGGAPEATSTPPAPEAATAQTTGVGGDAGDVSNTAAETASPEQGMTLADIRRYGAVAAAFALVGMGGIVLLAAVPDTMLKIGHFVLTPLPEAWRLSLMGFAESVIGPMQFVRSPSRVALGLLLTLCVWSCTALSTWLLSLGFDLQLSLSAVLVIQVAISLAVMLPQAPSFLGMFQAGAMTAVLLYDIGTGAAAAFANVLWAVNVLPVTVAGLIVLHAEGLSLRTLAHQSEQAAEELEEERPERPATVPDEDD
jgi:hypothetical protein